MSRGSAQDVITRCLAIAQCTETPGSITRTFLSNAMHNCHRLTENWMRAAGMGVRVDPIGNLRGFYPGTGKSSGRLLIGSHLDTVPNAGAYDGILGVMLGIGLVERLRGDRLPFAIEVIGFSDEEGVRFGVPFLGSSALVGAAGDALTARDRNGATVASAVRSFGLDPDRLADAAASEDSIGYLEFHIEQGPLLESIGRRLAVVDAIAGQSRYIVRFVGQPNHAGTTPMHLRRDALAGAAEWISYVEAYAAGTEGLVATVGRIEAEPGAANVIPGDVHAWLDVRHGNDEVRSASARLLITKAEEIGYARRLHVEQELLRQQPAVPMDTNLTAIAQRAIEACGLDGHHMTSGAGHDAMIIAEKIPSAMIFLRTPGGISHHPDETVLPDDVELALQAGEHFLEELVNISHA